MPNQTERKYEGFLTRKVHIALMFIGLFTVSTTVFGQSAQSFADMGWDKRVKGDYQAAIQDYNKAIALEPYKYHFYSQRAAVKADLEDFRGAIVDYQRALELNPSTKKPINSEPEDLIELVAKQNLPSIYVGLGQAYSRVGREKEAISAYTTALQYKPNDGYVYLLRGLAKALTSDKDGACLDWSKSGELGNSKAYEFIKQFCNE